MPFACCSSVLTGTKRMLGRCAASQMASASAASFFCRGYIRRLLVHGARAHLSWSRRKKQIRSAWLTGLLARRPTNVVLLAMANKTARIAWAMLSRGERYQERIAAAA